MLKEKWEKLKEKWFWITHPNLEYEIETREEKEEWLKYFKGKEWKGIFTPEEREQALDYLYRSEKEW